MKFDLSYPTGSDEFWLRTLHSRLNGRPQVKPARLADHRFRFTPRQDRMDILESYRRGHPPLPSRVSAREDVREFLRLARANYPMLTVEQLLDAVTLQGVRVGSDSALSDQLRRLMDGSGPWFADSADLMFTMGEAAVMVWSHEGKVVITPEDARQLVWDTYLENPTRVSRALKVRVDEWTGRTVAHLFIDEPSGARVRVATRDEGGRWEWDESRSGSVEGKVPGFRGMGIPIVPMVNKLRMGEFEPHLDNIDRINEGIGNRLWIAKAQAFRQLALEADKDSPDLDEDDDLDGKYRLSPDSLFVAPRGWSFKQIDPVDLRQHLEAVDKDVREDSSVSGTPLSATMSDAVNQSAEGARAAEKSRDSKAADRVSRLTPVVERVGRLAAAAGGLAIPDDAAVVPLWESIRSYSPAELGQAALSAQAAGLPRRVVWREFLHLSPEVISEGERLLASEQMDAMISAQIDAARSGKQVSGDGAGA